MVMSPEQQQAFERALVTSQASFAAIAAGLSRVDVRQVRAAPCVVALGLLSVSTPASSQTPLRQPPLTEPLIAG